VKHAVAITTAAIIGAIGSGVVTSAGAAGKKTLDNLGQYSCLLIEKTARNKRGVDIGTDLFLRCSVADYFIKFCESKIERSDIERYVDRGVTVRLELRDGEWDTCGDEAGKRQSRIGSYAVILELIE